jgi:hypothetical protein
LRSLGWSNYTTAFNKEIPCIGAIETNVDTLPKVLDHYSERTVLTITIVTSPEVYRAAIGKDDRVSIDRRMYTINHSLILVIYMVLSHKSVQGIVRITKTTPSKVDVI